jgi:hypothetical protein
MTDGIKVEHNGSVLEITIDRPTANAIDLRASRRLNEVFDEFRDDAALRVAIITGAGERFFSPGWDLKAAAAGEKSDEDWGVGGFGGLNYPRNLNKPIIAAVNGIACGGGFEIVLGTDIIVMEAHTLSCRRRIPHDGKVDGCDRGQALGPRKPRGCKGSGHGQGSRDRGSARGRAAAVVSGDQTTAAPHGDGRRARSLRGARFARRRAAGRALGGS